MPVPAVRERNATDVLERWMPVFPERTTRKLRYSTNFQFSGTVGVVTSYVFAANGLYDPDITGTGHQPMGFDQLMLSYNHYCVTHSRILVTFRNQASGSTPTVSITNQANNTPVTVIDQIIESGMCNMTVLSDAKTDDAVKVLEMKMNCAQFLGKVNILDDPDDAGNVNANPVEVEYFHVQAWDTNGVSTLIRCDAILEFTAVFTEPRILSTSLRAALSRMVIQESKGAKPS